MVADDDASEAEAESTETPDGNEDTEHEGERVMGRSDGAAILREVASGVENGEIDIEGANGFTAAIPERFELEVEYEVGDDEAELEVELEWPIEDGEAVSVDAE
ncbi:amphi-Trp domain-containing protein [Halovivax limisalsi]|uniref:amphi-Trp domain-containing protein n=1 Tax=Halovivax limisalsi TaxID=1453760 RepID=UPI001FFD07BC|nr:amphi-Trp domain-containing protein [Halovivax limisalsi]